MEKCTTPFRVNENARSLALSAFFVHLEHSWNCCKEHAEAAPEQKNKGSCSFPC